MKLPAYGTALEPVQLVDAFMAHPPEGFEAAWLPGRVPGFVAPFDLLTSADEALRRRVAGWPLYRHWGGWLRWRTRFAGCTCTEYLPLPRDADPAALAEDWLALARRGREALFIVKDLPNGSPLLDAEANRRAAELAGALVERGFVLLEGMPLAWVPLDDADEEAYLRRLSPARRKDIRRKLRARAELQIDDLATGDPRLREPALRADILRLYRAVYAQSQTRFDALTADFLGALLDDPGSGGRLFTYRAAGELIGWNLCYEHEGMLVDKYIGLAYPQARRYNLYAVSWMHNLAHARRRGLSHYVAGWTDTAVKRALGARFDLTRHAVYARSPVLRALLRRLAGWFEGEARALA